MGSTKIVRNSGSETVKQVPLMRCGCMNKTQPIYINAFCLYLNGFVASNMDLLAFICCFLHRTANKFNIFFIFVAFHIHIPCELFLLVCNSLLPHSSWFQTRFSNSREKKAFYPKMLMCWLRFVLMQEFLAWDFLLLVYYSTVFSFVVVFIVVVEKLHSSIAHWTNLFWICSQHEYDRFLNVSN